MDPRGKYLFLWAFFMVLKMSYQIEKPYYTAGVVEYYSIKDNPDAVATVSGNADNFIKIMKTAAENNVDILVFPEGGLWNGLYGNKSKTSATASPAPDPRDLEAPCDSPNNYPQYFRDLSCAARKYRIYTVINMVEKAKCSVGEPCTDKTYNTNIAFDRTGRVVARYRKFNLFYDEKMILSGADKPELSYFKTDFNVTFGMFICFDIVFKSPPLELLRKHNIHDIAYSTNWVSVLPFLTALQYHFGFAYANDVNFLGSGGNTPAMTSRGSGIYAGRQILAKYWSEEPSNVLLVANVPKVMENGQRDPSVATNAKTIKFSSSEIASIPEGVKGKSRTFLQDRFNNYTTEVYDPRKTSQKRRKLCHHEVCCEFQIRSIHSKEKEGSDYYRYRMAVFAGVRYLGTVTGGVEICALITCRNDTLESCGYLHNGNVSDATVFTSVKISRSLERNFETNHSYVPSTLSTDTNLISPKKFTFTIDKKKHMIKMALKKPEKHLFVFGIIGRNFINDGKNAENIWPDGLNPHIIKN